MALFAIYSPFLFASLHSEPHFKARRRMPTKTALAKRANRRMSTAPLVETRDELLTPDVGLDASDVLPDNYHLDVAQGIASANAALGESSPTEHECASPFQPAVSRDVDKGGLHEFVCLDDFVLPLVQDKALVSKRTHAPLSDAPVFDEEFALLCGENFLGAIDEELAQLGGDTFFGAFDKEMERLGGETSLRLL